MQLFILDKNNIIVQKNIENNFINKMRCFFGNVLLSDNSLVKNYPLDIILNSFTLGDLFIHNIKYTDSAIIRALNGTKKLINVKQGYTKCSTAIVNDQAVITNDIGIAKALHNENLEVLYLNPGDIVLEGFDYGFIGGSCGLLDKSTIAFFGNLNRYKYGSEVKEFLKKHKVDVYCLSDGKLTDRGTLFCF